MKEISNREQLVLLLVKEALNNNNLSKTDRILTEVEIVLLRQEIVKKPTLECFTRLLGISEEIIEGYYLDYGDLDFIENPDMKQERLNEIEIEIEKEEINKTYLEIKIKENK